MKDFLSSIVVCIPIPDRIGSIERTLSLVCICLVLIKVKHLVKQVTFIQLYVIKWREHSH